MTSAFFDAGDFQRLDRERTLIEQSDRIPAQPDQSPIEEPIQGEPENNFDIMLDGLFEAFLRRLQ